MMEYSLLWDRPDVYGVRVQLWAVTGAPLPPPIAGVSTRYPHPWFLRNDMGRFRSMHPPTNPDGEFDPTAGRLTPLERARARREAAKNRLTSEPQPS